MAARTGNTTSSAILTTAILPQNVPAIDPKTNTINKQWWLQMQEQTQLVNTLSAHVTALMAAASGGGGGSTPATGLVVLAIASNAVTPDLSQGLSFEVVLNQSAQITINNPIFTGGMLAAGNTFQLTIIQDATGERPVPAWGTAFGQDTALQQLSTVLSTGSSFLCRLHSDGLWHLDATPTTGQILT